MIDGRRSIADLSPQQIVEYGSDVFFAFEIHSVNVVNHDLDQICVVNLLSQLCYQFGLRLLIIRTVQYVFYSAYTFCYVFGYLNIVQFLSHFVQMNQYFQNQKKKFTFSYFLSPFSRAVKSSLRPLTSSCGLLLDLPKRNISCIDVEFFLLTFRFKLFQSIRVREQQQQIEINKQQKIEALNVCEI